MTHYIITGVMFVFLVYQYLVILSLVRSINSLRPWVVAVTDFIAIVDGEIAEMQKNKNK